MEYTLTTQATICDECNTSPKKELDGVIRCKCAGKPWHNAAPVQADGETEALLERKGFRRAGWYYYSGDGQSLTIYDNGHWELTTGGEQPINKNLKEFLLSLPDAPQVV
jgi:hypothetical protein